jgi:hypothetical protein
MGRIKKYNTPEEKLQAQKEWSKKYYWDNKEKADKNAKERYWKRKKDMQTLQ